MKKYKIVGSNKIWSKEEIVQEGLEIREVFMEEGIEDTDILNIILGREEVVKKRFIEERGLYGFDLELDLWRVREWYKTFVLLEGWEEVEITPVFNNIRTYKKINENVYQIFKDNLEGYFED